MTPLTRCHYAQSQELLEPQLVVHLPDEPHKGAARASVRVIMVRADPRPPAGDIHGHSLSGARTSSLSPVRIALWSFPFKEAHKNQPRNFSRLGEKRHDRSECEHGSHTTFYKPLEEEGPKRRRGHNKQRPLCFAFS